MYTCILQERATALNHCSKESAKRIWKVQPRPNVRIAPTNRYTTCCSLPTCLPLHQDKRIFIKDITHYLVPPSGKPASIAPSLHTLKRGVGTNGDAPSTNGHATNGSSKSGAPYPYHTAAEPGNPTVIPQDVLKQFHFAFLIRHPKHSIPSYFRCTVPPLDKITGFYDFMPAEAGYDEQRRVFDYLRQTGQIGPKVCGQGGMNANETNGHAAQDGTVDICVIDADDLLDHPAFIVETFCKSVGIEYSPDLLLWETEEDHRIAKNAFEKWRGFHEDAINSTSLKPRVHVRNCLPALCYTEQMLNSILEESRKDRRAVLRGVG